MGDVEHTLHGARWSSGDEFFGPEEGERWLVLDMELTNTGDSSEVVSSMLMWTLVDEDNRSAEIALTGDEQGGLDGELGAGRSMRGETAFVMPDMRRRHRDRRRSRGEDGCGRGVIACVRWRAASMTREMDISSVPINGSRP